MPILKGVNIKKLTDCALEKNKNIINLRAKDVMESIGDIEVDKTYWILITNDVLTSTKGLTFAGEDEELKKYGCRRLKGVEAVALLITTFVSTQRVLYESQMDCEEHLNGYHVMVGGFGPKGFSILYSFTLPHHCVSGTGAAGVWEVR